MAFVKHTKSESFEVIREDDPKEAFKEAKKREEDERRLAEEAAQASPDKQS
jgi:hypothetical protein